ncbi:MAG: DUF3782 domain-containing protein, partial [Candidatus Anammoxibacter sp.]
MNTIEIEKGFQEIWRLFKETDKRTEKRFKITEEEIEKTSKTVEETSKTVKETSKALDVTRKTVEETSKSVNALTGKWGRFVEGLIVPAAERLFKERGIIIDKVSQRVKTHHNGDTMEIDILAINGEYAVLIEAKSTLKVEDIKEHIERLADFKKFFPEYKDKKVLGAVGGIVIEEHSDIFAYKQG